MTLANARHHQGYCGACRSDRACTGTTEPADLIGRARMARALCKALHGKRCNCASCAFCLSRKALGSPRFFSEVRQHCLIKSYARKYSMFLQHLQVIMSLSLCVAMIDFNVLIFALDNTQKRFEKQSDSSSSYTNCNVFL